MSVAGSWGMRLGTEKCNSAHREDKEPRVTMQSSNGLMRVGVPRIVGKEACNTRISYSNNFYRRRLDEVREVAMYSHWLFALAWSC